MYFFSLAENIYKYLCAKVQVISDTESAKDVINNTPIDNVGGEGGEGGDTPPEPELTQSISNGLQTFTITFNKTISNINFNAITFKCNGGIYNKDTDYIVSQGVGNNVFVVNFPNVGDTYTMYINISEGAITLGEDKNSKIEYTYSYKDGAPSI